MELDEIINELNSLETDQLIPILGALVIMKSGHVDEVMDHLKELINTRVNAEAYR